MVDAISIALAFNLVVLAPVLIALIFAPAGVSGAFGPDSAARRILTCLYAAIAAASLGLFAARYQGAGWTTTAALTLFAMQITYKLLTVPAVGLRNPVVIANLVVVAVQAAAIMIEFL